ncbi:MAG: hypothetical protein ACR2JE_06645 [Acidobacteriaceae bacterium]
MKITIDNRDGKGTVDYSAALAGAASLKIERKLNAPTVCQVSLLPTNAAIPARNGRVMVSADNGRLLFSGYVACEPERIFAGEGCEGTIYLLVVSALSDDIILDRQRASQTTTAVSQAAGDVLNALTLRAGGGIDVTAQGATAMIGSFTGQAGQSWSSNTGLLASAGRTAYRVVNGEVSLTSIGSTVHTLSETDGSLKPALLTAVRARELVNDVTVCGAVEAQNYVTEIFQGDGVTSSFILTQAPLLRKAKIIEDAFTGSSINPLLWTVQDPGNRVTLTAAGLTVNGGSGIEGQTNVGSVDAVEMGGVLLLEAAGLQVQGTGEGYVAGFYSGTAHLENLFAGFHVKATAGALSIAPVVEGAEAGGSVTVVSGHTYTLRLRFHCKDVQRVLQSYYVSDGASNKSFGGDLITAGGDLVLELQETTGGTLRPPVTLYAGNVAAAPASCRLVAFDSVSFVGSLASVSLQATGGIWATSTPNGGNGTPQTLRLGTMAEGADAKMESSGKLVFYATSVPKSGSQITVTYRIAGRAAARLASTSSMAEEASGALPGTAQWVGSMRLPATRCSTDCENAALAILDMASSRDAAWAGSYQSFNLAQQADVWPGDALAIDAPSSGMAATVVVREVTVQATSANPEILQYTLKYANDWAEPLSLATSNVLPKDVQLPEVAANAPLAVGSLRDLTVDSITTTAINVTAGAAPPQGGGFEVRRRDWIFGAGDAVDVVLRSPVPNFTIVRAFPIEQYYVRMYDGANPPNYSRFSSAIFVNVMM